MSKKDPILSGWRRLEALLAIFLAMGFLTKNASLRAQTYCTPTYTNSCTSGDYIDSFVVKQGAATVFYTAASGCDSSTTNYVFRTAAGDTIVLIKGQAYELTVVAGSWDQYFAFWIDANGNGWDSSDGIAASGSRVSSWTTTFTAPTGSGSATYDTTRWRIRSSWSSIGLADSCNNQSYGETEDHVVILAPPSGDDVGVSVVDSPVSSCGLGANEPVWLTVHNYGTTLSAGTSIPYSVQVDAGTVCTDTLTVGSGGLATGGDTTINSGCTGDFSTVGSHTVMAWTSMTGDVDNSNDTGTTTLQNDLLISSFPYTESFESGPAGWRVESDNGITTWELGQLSASGTPGTIDTAAEGLYAWETDTDGNYLNNERGWVLSPCFDFSGMTNPPKLTLSVWWSSETGWDGGAIDTGDASGGNWGRLGTYGDPNNWYNRSYVSGLNSWTGNSNGWSGSSTNSSGGWVDASRIITEYAGRNGYVRFRVMFGSDGSVNGYDGFAFDYVRVSEVQNDVGVSAVDSPVSACGLDSTESVWITVHNYGAALSSGTAVPYSVQVDGGVVCNDTLTIGSNGLAQGADTTFNSGCTGDFSTAGNHTVAAWTALSGDVDATNDSVNAQIITIPTISSFPYVEDFESGNGGWYPVNVMGGTSAWEWGDPSAYTYTNNNINTAGQGSKAWEVDIDGGYDNSQIVALVSPCFDFSSSGRVTLAFLANWNSESNYDGTRFDTLINGVNDYVDTDYATNWYTHSNVWGLGSPAWSGSGSGWQTATKVFPHQLAGKEVQFAFIFGSDGSVNGYDGFAVDSFAVSVLSYCYIDTSMLTICQGDSIQIHGVYRSTAGTYIDTFTVNGCDSISVVFLSVNPTYDTTVSSTICSGDTAWIGNTPYTQSGTYTDTLTAGSGCDSVVTLNLTVLPSPQTSDTVSICQGDSALIHGTYRTVAGTYVGTYTAANGCDSVSTVTLVVHPSYNIQQTLTMCQGDSVQIFGQWQYNAGTYDSLFTTVNGCDSMVTITLTVYPTYSVQDTLQMCQGDSVQVFGNWVYGGGTFDSLFTTVNGCDSMVTVTVVVHPVYTTMDTVTICQGDSALIHGTWQSQPGVYAHTYSSMAGCDSTVYTSLIVHPTYSVTVSDTICSGDTAWLGNTPYTQSGTYTGTLATVWGCDSVVTLHLSVIEIDTSVVVSGDTLIAQQSNASYQWLDCGNNMSPISGATSQTYVPATSGSYAVQIAYQQCVATSGCHTIVMAGISEVAEAFGLHIYPNPTRGMLYFDAVRPGTYALRLYDLLGKEHLRRRAAIRRGYVLDLSQLSKGVYFLEISDGSKVEVVKLIVK